MTSLDCIFKPSSIAIIGASRRPKTIGREIIHNLINNEFSGSIYPVNPKAEVVHSIRCFASIEDIPWPVDLAVITVPKQHVPGVVEQCGRKGVKGIIVITAGFQEVGGEGVERERELLALVRKYNMRMVGPNCMGVFNTAEGTSMNATFAPTKPRRGHVSFVSQSGALGVAILENAASLGLGLAMFASVGNKADVSANDLLEYWRDDGQTKLLLMYLESVGNPKKFIEIARSITRYKPIIAAKSGRTLAGASAASSHTGALAGSDRIIDALFQQTGILRVNSIEELFDVAIAFETQPVPQGNQVAILTNAGGPAIMATDALVNWGMKLSEFTRKTEEKLKKIVTAESSIRNPVDMTAAGGASSYKLAMEAILADPNVDSLLVIFVPPITVNSLEVATIIAQTNHAYRDKTLLCCFMSQDKESVRYLRDQRVPVYTFPESAATALAALDRHRGWLTKPQGVVPAFTFDRDKIDGIILKARESGNAYLSQEQVYGVFAACGMQVASNKVVTSEDEAVQYAAELQAPVVLKAISQQIVHKTDVGGVKVDLRNEEEIRKAYRGMIESLKKHNLDQHLEGVLIQEMLKGGKEIVLGMNRDKSFGPVIMVGLGGVYVEVIKDVSFGIAPLTDVNALDMISSLRSYPLLQGVRGEKAVDIQTIIEYIQKLSQLALDFPELAELDINPFMVFETGASSRAVDGRIKLVEAAAN